jgi:hypothetical protein
MATPITSVTCLPLTRIDGVDCIGDSRQIINNNITQIGQTLCTLTTNTIFTFNSDTVSHAFNTGTRTLSSNVRDTSITANKLASNSVTTTKLDNSVQQLLVPTGSVMSFAMSAAPTGWYPCDGTTVSRTGSGSNLFAAIGTIYGIGDNSTTFNVPNMRGMFIRGWTPDTTLTSRDPLSGSRTLGSVQEDAFESHTHSDPTWNGISGGGFEVPTTNAGYDYGGASAPTGATGDLETRPVNIALLYCIKL